MSRVFPPSGFFASMRAIKPVNVLPQQVRDGLILRRAVIDAVEQKPRPVKLQCQLHRCLVRIRQPAEDRRHILQRPARQIVLIQLRELRLSGIAPASASGGNSRQTAPRPVVELRLAVGADLADRRMEIGLRKAVRLVSGISYSARGHSPFRSSAPRSGPEFPACCDSAYTKRPL